jgi:hypothetical protein
MWRRKEPKSVGDGGGKLFKNKKVEGQSEIKRSFLIFAVRAKIKSFKKSGGHAPSSYAPEV